VAAYEYVALDQRGKQKKGVLEADSGRQIRQSLRDMGLVPLSVEPTTQPSSGARPGASAWSRFSSRLWQRGMSTLDLALFTRQLSTLVAASLPLEEALQAIAQQSEKRHVSSLVMSVRSKVLEGHSLAGSMAEFPGTFSHMFRSTVAAGEQSSYLDKVLSNLADYTEGRFESRRNVEMALFYPIILLVLAFLIVGGLMAYVVPDIVKVFVNTGQELPLLTRALIGISDFLRSYYWLLILLFAAAVYGLRSLLAQPDVRLAWDRRKLSLPLVRRITRGGNAARYANTLSILTSSGVPLVEAMNIASDVVSNTYLKRRLNEATRKVAEGSSLRVALDGAGYFPPMMLHMVASGEASGELDNMLQRVADYQQKELERMVGTLVRLFEPLMLLVMGGLVMMIVLAILLPILNMNQLLE